MEAERQLMERAARAAGIELLCWDNERQAFKLPPRAGRASRWNPWTDDGDAFRLQCRLSMTVAIDSEDKTATAVFYGGKLATEPCENHQAATAAARRAIVKCAALALDLLRPSDLPACPESGNHCRWVEGECQTCGITPGVNPSHEPQGEQR